MQNKLSCILLGIASTALCTTSLCAEVRPNILIFLVDDMGLMDSSVPFLSENGEPKIHTLNQRYRTPNIESLASQGLRYERFYANSVCSPSRVSLLTGQNSARHRTTQWIYPYGKNGDPQAPKNWNWQGLKEDSVTLPRILSLAGYETIHVGKGHWGPLDYPGADPLRIGFKHNIAGAAWGRPGSYYGKKNFTDAQNLRQPPHLEAYHGKDTHLTEALTDKMLERLDAAHATGKPIFAHMSFYAVHSPFEADAKFLKNYPQDFPGRAFAAMIEGMDHSVGKILNHLKTLGIAEETIVFFLGDNGSDYSSRPLRGKKAERYEGGTRVPFMVSWAQPTDSSLQDRWPIPQGVLHNSSFGTILDLMPTILKLTGTQAPKDHTMDGYDLRAVTAGESPQTFLMHFPHKHRSAYFTTWHNGNWKLIYQYSAEPRMQLFNLAEDIDESNDLAVQRPGRLQEMFLQMEGALNECQALYPVNSQTKQSLSPYLY